VKFFQHAPSRSMSRIVVLDGRACLVVALAFAFAFAFAMHWRTCFHVLLQFVDSAEQGQWRHEVAHFLNQIQV